MAADGTISCIITKGLIPFVEREVGPEGVAAIVERAGRPREWLMAEYNYIPLSLAGDLLQLSMRLMGETDEERWVRRFGDDLMDWKPSREERGWAGAYTMSLGSPGAIYGADQWGWLLSDASWSRETLEFRRTRATYRLTPQPGVRLPRWLCTLQRAILERYPTNWGLPRAVVTERACAARGDDACLWDIRWKNPPLGRRFWMPAMTAAAGAAAAVSLAAAQAIPWEVGLTVAALLPLSGVSLGFGLLQQQRHRRARDLLKVQGDEVLYSSRELEGKFRDLGAKVEQLSLLIDLSGAVNATLDVERIYEQACERLVHAMGYGAACLYLVEPGRDLIRGHRMAGGDPEARARFREVELPLAGGASTAGTVVTTGAPVIVDDVDAPAGPVHLATARALVVRSFVMVPLAVKDRVFGALAVMAGEPNRFTAADVELLSAVANHVALAVDRAESFQTIEELSRGLDDKVRVRTEQLRAANEELSAAYRNLQQTQMQLIQREKMASVGQLVAGVAHELNNPIGFVYSNVATLEDFVRRLRAMLDAYRTTPLPEGPRAGLQARWDELKVDYALRYLDAMTQGIREGAERARKIVRDLRVFARSDHDAWQPVDLHGEIESSLTLLNHLLKDRVTVHRKFGDLPSVECVRSQIDQVFLNVLANAAQAIQGPGELTIQTRAEDGFAVVTVADSGPGIPADVIGRIFDPFFTTKPVGEGTGLGLSISYEIVKRHAGEIIAASQPSQGATLTLRLPLARRSA
jgi:two-component system NtrC family sensor kinase